MCQKIHKRRRLEAGDLPAILTELARWHQRVKLGDRITFSTGRRIWCVYLLGANWHVAQTSSVGTGDESYGESGLECRLIPARERPPGCSGLIDRDQRPSYPHDQ
jgi:hypothetical protein